MISTMDYFAMDSRLLSVNFVGHSLMWSKAEFAALNCKLAAKTGGVKYQYRWQIVERMEIPTAEIYKFAYHYWME